MALWQTPNAFVMSSTEGRRVADPLVALLAEGGGIDVRTWHTGVFAPGDTFLETLRRATLRFDFGVLVITPDDLTSVRGIWMAEPRDNLIFEFGLFLSALGPRRALAVVATIDTEEPKLPTDYTGHARIPITLRSDTDMRSQLAEPAAFLKQRMIDLYGALDYGLLPSTVLAIGYFNNFIEPLTEGLRLYSEVSIGGGDGRRQVVAHGNWRLSICIPERLSDATREQWAEMADALDLQQGTVAIPPNATMLRPYPFRICARLDGGPLEIYDTPTTLRTVYDAVRKLMPGATAPDIALAEERGVSDFARTLRHMLEDSGRASLNERIELIGWQELRERRRP